MPDLGELLRLAEVLQVPLEWFASGRWRPAVGLKGIAIELHRLGIDDYAVAGAKVPGAFRHPEEVVVLALRGDRPEVRVVEAMPLVLATKKLRVPLVLAFASAYDPRVRHRLGWLCDITLTLGRLSSFPVPLVTEVELGRLRGKVKKAAEPDSLGHLGDGRPPLLWRRWNITYGGTIESFSRRIRAVAGSESHDEDEE